MKKILLIALLILGVSQANAQISNDLVGLGMKAELADYISGIIPGGAVLSNNVSLKGRNQAGSADIALIKVDATDDTTVISDSGDIIKFLLQGDAKRLVSMIGSSDTAVRITWGDGSTASQILQFNSSDADASDDGALVLAGGGDEDKTRGGYIQLNGNEFSGAGDVTLATGSAAGSSLLVDLNATAGTLVVRDSAAAAVMTLTESTKQADFTGNVNSTGLRFPTANFEAVAGAGTTVADAAALSATKHVHQLTGANGTVGWKFATSVAGQFEFLLNTTAGVPKVYAASGGTCNGGATDAACTLVTGIVAHLCYSTAVNTWICS